MSGFKIYINFVNTKNKQKKGAQLSPLMYNFVDGWAHYEPALSMNFRALEWSVQEFISQRRLFVSFESNNDAFYLPNGRINESFSLWLI